MRNYTGTIILLLTLYSAIKCNGRSDLKKAIDINISSYTNIDRYVEPQYSLTGLHATSDTVSFRLEKYNYNIIKSLNLFSVNGEEYIAFLDRQSGSITIYDFKSKNQISEIVLNKHLPASKPQKAVMFCKNFDSIFVVYKRVLYLIDSSGTVKKTVDILEEPWYIQDTYGSSNRFVFKDGILYAGVYSYIDATSWDELKKWRALIGFDLNSERGILYYQLPEIYQKNLYGSDFLKCNYCYNNRGNFVFSFPADTSIYETNLSDYHATYFGKSFFQKEKIKPVRKEDLSGMGGYKSYITRDSYGVLYFDPSHKRYLRIANSKISEEDYQLKRWRGKTNIIIFDENFKIIGESELDANIQPNSIFFTSDGSVYARTKVNDEYFLHFVRLTYDDSHYSIMDSAKK